MAATDRGVFFQASTFDVNATAPFGLKPLHCHCSAHTPRIFFSRRTIRIRPPLRQGRLLPRTFRPNISRRLSLMYQSISPEPRCMTTPLESMAWEIDTLVVHPAAVCISSSGTKVRELGQGSSDQMSAKFFLRAGKSAVGRAPPYHGPLWEGVRCFRVP